MIGGCGCSALAKVAVKVKVDVGWALQRRRLGRAALHRHRTPEGEMRAGGTRGPHAADSLSSVRDPRSPASERKLAAASGRVSRRGARCTHVTSRTGRLQSHSPSDKQIKMSMPMSRTSIFTVNGFLY